MARTVVTTGTTTSMEDRLAPVIEALAQPLVQLRASLGTATGQPPADTLTALTNAHTTVSATEDPQRLGLYQLESTDTAAAATPSIRVTGREVAAGGDRIGTASTLLAAAHTTQATAAAKVDQIIADFRTQAKQLASKSTTSADTAKIIDLAADKIREAVTVTSAASTEMDDHTRKLSALGDNGGTNGTGVSVPPGFQGGTGTLGTGGTSTTAGTGTTLATSGTTNLGTGGTSTGTGSSLSSLLASTELPDDPNLRAQVLLQYAALEAGVSLGDKALDAGVSIGSKLIESIAGVIEHGFDKGAEVATSAIDTLADKADATVQQALTGDTGTGTSTPGTGTPSTGTGTGAPKSDTLFGGLGGASKPEAPASSGTGAAPSVAEKPSNGQSVPAPTQAPSSPAPSQAPFQSAPGTGAQTPMQGGVVTPPVAKPSETEHKPTVGTPSTNPKRGQAGVLAEDGER